MYTDPRAMTHIGARRNLLILSVQIYYVDNTCFLIMLSIQIYYVDNAYVANGFYPNIFCCTCFCLLCYQPKYIELINAYVLKY